MTDSRELDRIFLRGLLAASGILLDPPIAPAPSIPGIEPTIPAQVDRDAVRAVIVAAGAPERDLEWLVASCQSIDAARAYRPPPTYAWCVD